MNLRENALSKATTSDPLTQSGPDLSWTKDISKTTITPEAASRAQNSDAFTQAVNNLNDSTNSSRIISRENVWNNQSGNSSQAGIDAGQALADTLNRSGRSFVNNPVAKSAQALFGGFGENGRAIMLNGGSSNSDFAERYPEYAEEMPYYNTYLRTQTDPMKLSSIMSSHPTDSDIENYHTWAQEKGFEGIDDNGDYSYNLFPDYDIDALGDSYLDSAVTDEETEETTYDNPAGITYTQIVGDQEPAFSLSENGQLLNWDEYDSIEDIPEDFRDNLQNYGRSQLGGAVDAVQCLEEIYDENSQVAQLYLEQTGQKWQWDSVTDFQLNADYDDWYFYISSFPSLYVLDPFFENGITPEAFDDWWNYYTAIPLSYYLENDQIDQLTGGSIWAIEEWADFLTEFGIEGGNLEEGQGYTDAMAAAIEDMNNGIDSSDDYTNAYAQNYEALFNQLLTQSNLNTQEQIQEALDQGDTLRASYLQRAIPRSDEEYAEIASETPNTLDYHLFESEESLKDMVPGLEYTDEEGTTYGPTWEELPQYVADSGIQTENYDPTKQITNLSDIANTATIPTSASYEDTQSNRNGWYALINNIYSMFRDTDDFIDPANVSAINTSNTYIPYLQALSSAAEDTEEEEE